MDVEPGEPKIRVGPDFEREWPGARARATECILNLVYLSSQIDAFGQAFVRQHGIPSVTAFNVLTILHGAGESLPPSVIAERLILTRGTMTVILDSLEKRGLIERRPHEQDGRMRRVTITPSGLTAVTTILPRLHQAERAWTSVLSDAQQASLLELLGRLQANPPDKWQERI